MYEALVISDIHLTDNLAHEYRWTCLDEAAAWAQSDSVSCVIVAGDIFDAKDRHSSALVNRFLTAFAEIHAAGKPIIVLRGNHDYVDKECPFLHFLRYFPNVTYVDKPMVVTVPGGYTILAVPHGAPWDEYAEWRKELPLSGGHAFILAHQTFCGATVNGAGKVLDKGPAPELVSKAFTGGAPVVSGDIHQAQVLGNVVYIGSPHPVAFGETGGRFLKYNFETQRFKGIRRNTVQRLVLSYALKDDGTSIDDPSFESLREGDHVQISVSCTRAALTHFPEFRNKLQKQCNDAKVLLFKLQACVSELYSHVGVDTIELVVRTDKDIFVSFCEMNEVPLNIVEVGEVYVDV